MAFSVRLAAADDRPRILEAVAELLPDVDPVRRYDWIYAGNPHGRALTWLATDDESGALAGLTSFFRRRMIVDGKEVGGALGGDGYVRPSFRRRGLGALMHQQSRRDMAANGVQVMFGTPMPANLTPLTQAGARTITDTVRYVRALTARGLKLPGALPQRLLSPLIAPRRRQARLEAVVVNDRRVDEIWEATRGELGIATVRDAAFYSWRFVQSPSQKQLPFVVVEGGRPLAACALERLGSRLRVIDLVAPRHVWGRVFGALASFGPGCDIMELKLTREDGRARSLWRYGFFARDTKPLNLLLPADCREESVLYDPKRWFFTWAEADLDFG